MKILVTGASGFIGNYVIKELVKLKEHEIIATSIDPENKIRNFSWYADVKYICRNLNEDHDDYFAFFGKPDALIHLSWEGLPNFKELYHFERNTFKNYFFLKNMILNGQWKF